MEKHVTSFSISKKLKKLGVKQQSQFYWIMPDVGTKDREYFIKFDDPDNGICIDESCKHKPISAFLASELGDILDAGLEQIWRQAQSGKWSCGYESLDHSTDDPRKFIHGADTMTDALGLMLIYLLENKLIKLS